MPALIWNRTVQRPLLLAFFWDGILVHVTTGNHAGMRVSCTMYRVLSANALLRMTLIRWKDHLRRNTDFLGPNLGQVSTYAILLVLLQYDSVLASQNWLPLYEQLARSVVAAHIGASDQPPRVCDGSGVNVTARSYLAHHLALELTRMPSVSPQ